MRDRGGPSIFYSTSEEGTMVEKGHREQTSTCIRRQWLSPLHIEHSALLMPGSTP